MSPRGYPQQVSGRKNYQEWHPIGIYSAMTPLGAMQQALVDIPPRSGFTHLRALPTARSPR